MDPFHVVAWATETVDKVGRRLAAALRTDRDDAGLQLVKGSRWALLKNPGTLRGDQGDILEGLREANNDLWTAYMIKEQLRAVFNPPSGIGGTSVLAAWLQMADQTGIDLIDELAAKVRRVLPLIRNTIDHGVSSAAAEANNTTVRMLSRRGFGYHDPDALIAITMLKRSGLCPALPGRRQQADPHKLAKAA